MSLEKVIFGWMFIGFIFISAFVLFFPEKSKQFISFASKAFSEEKTNKPVSKKKVVKVVNKKVPVSEEKSRLSEITEWHRINAQELNSRYSLLQKGANHRFIQLCKKLGKCADFKL